MSIVSLAIRKQRESNDFRGEDLLSSQSSRKDSAACSFVVDPANISSKVSASLSGSAIFCIYSLQSTAFAQITGPFFFLAFWYFSYKTRKCFLQESETFAIRIFIDLPKSKLYHNVAENATIFVSSCFGGRIDQNFSASLLLCFQKKNALMLIQGTKAS